MPIKITALCSILLFLSFSAFGQTPSPSIEVKNSKVYLSGSEMKLPILNADLERLLGKPDRTFDGARRVAIWDNSGLIAYQQAGEETFLEIGIILDVKENLFEFTPKKPFRGSFIIDGAKITSSSSLSSINRQKKGSKFKPIPLVKVLSEYTSGNLYLVMWQTEKARNIASANVLQISIAAKQE